MTERKFTFLFTDIEGSTRLWERDAGAMSSVLARHDAVLHEAVKAHRGQVFKTIGDAFCAVFTSAEDALKAGVEAQKMLRARDVPVRVRMALHTGWAEERDDDYFGPTLNRTARLLGAGHGGQILLSGASREALGDDPELELRDLGTHRLRDLSEPIHVYHAITPGLANNFEPLKSLTPRPTNLPAALTSFVGRETEIADIGAKLRHPQVRLLTLTGPGGIGKTRLALQTAGNQRDEFEDGVFFVALAAVREPELAADAIARALKVEEQQGESIAETIKARLRDRHLLLVFDNFEQILDAAPLVNELLADAPRLKVLATSREALFIYGEQTYAVQPLGVPDERQRITPRDAQQYPAVSLFVERARAAMPDFALTEASTSGVSEICRRLDGLPLAIELAAARIRSLPLEDIVGQLTARLNLLSAGPRDLPARQQTMRGAIDWSYHLLTPEEQRLFARLAAFTGQFTGEAASAVTGSSDFDHLVNANLLRREVEAEGVPEFDMLEVLREYALERLNKSGEMPETQRRHATYYRDFLETAEPHLTSPDQRRWFDGLEMAHPNLRAALDWSLALGEGETAGRIAAVVWRLWVVHSHLTEGHQRMAQALGAQLPARLRARVLHGAGRLEIFRADFSGAESLLNDSLGLFQSLDDPRGQATCLLELGEIKTMRGDYAGAERLLAESLALHRELGDARASGRLLDNLGSIARMLDNHRDAELFYRESLDAERNGGSAEGQARVLNNLAEMMRVQGKFAEAIETYQQSLTLYRALDFSFGVGTLLLNLADTERDRGDHARAVDYYREALDVLRDLDEAEIILAALTGLAGATQRQGDLHRAARLNAAVGELAASTGLALQPADQEEHDRTRTALRARLDDAAWAAALSEGRAMSLEQALNYALGSGS